MTQTLRTTFQDDTWKLIFDEQAKMQKQKLRKVTPAQVIEKLLRDAYLRSTEKKDS